MYILNVLPNLTAVMQETVCSSEQKISANLSLTLNECMKPCENAFHCRHLQKSVYKDKIYMLAYEIYKFIIKLFDLMRKGLVSDMTLEYGQFI